MKRALAMLPVLACAGCLGADQPMTANLDALALAPPASHSAPSGGKRSVAGPIVELPPEAASVAGVSRSWQASGFSQRIRLSTDARKPESRIDVAIQTRNTPESLNPAANPSDTAIRAELLREFPGVPMQIAPPGDYRNAYGDFGLAIGRSGDALRCIYVWQYVEDARSSFTGGEPIAAKGAEPAPASLRMKLCRTDMTVDELASAASRIEIEVPDNLNARPRDIKRAGEPMLRTAESAPVRQNHASGYMMPVRSAAREGQRFLASPSGAPYATSSGAFGASTVGAANLPPQAFTGPAGAPVN
jgi:hypothetical protein